ncbi:hypothetical protein BES08_11945 [Novosphingobium resinovorum]|uniref:Uncharacterized protein n=2 Tax=Novosphingobium resinovorum TaxID=158500 RepID=A0A1D8A5J8_9SPHN|nr:hypothetical protein BES08_11945 [Novosphingobium resinovorum]
MAIAQGRTDDAVAFARKRLRKGPIPIENHSALLRALIRDGDTEAVPSVLQVAASRGWRDTPVQTLTAQAAIAGEEPTIAAQRLFAIASAKQSRLPYQSDSVRQLMAAPGVADLYGAQLAAVPAEAESFMAYADGELSEVTYRTVLAGYRRAGGHLDCAAVLNIAEERLARPDLGAATALWDATCRDGNSHAERDKIAFTDPASVNLYNWRYDSITDVSRTASGWSLSFQNPSARARTLGTKLFDARPGTLTVWLREGRTDAILIAEVACPTGDGGKTAVIGSYGLSRGAPISFTVPSGCDHQYLRLLAPPQSSGQDLTIGIHQKST